MYTLFGCSLSNNVKGHYKWEWYAVSFKVVRARPQSKTTITPVCFLFFYGNVRLRKSDPYRQASEGHAWTHQGIWCNAWLGDYFHSSQNWKGCVIKTHQLSLLCQSFFKIDADNATLRLSIHGISYQQMASKEWKVKIVSFGDVTVESQSHRDWVWV